MKYLVGYTDPFVSPLTGRLRTVGQFPPIGFPDYTIIGDKQGNAIVSPILIDIRLELNRLRSILGTAGFIIKSKIAEFNNAQALDQLTNGFLYNTDGVLSINVPGGGTIALPYGQVFVGDEDNLAQATQLLNKQLLIGNSSDRAEAITVLFLENMANLSNKRIWRGNTSNRPEESDALTTIENQLPGILSQLSDLANIINTISNTVAALSTAVEAIEASLALIGGAAALVLLQLQVLGLLGAVSGLDSRLRTAEGEIDTIQGQVSDIYNQLSSINLQLTSINDQITTINGEITSIHSDIDSINSQISFINSQLTEITNDITAINTRIDNLRLNTIPADGDVSFYGYKLTNLADATEETDGVNVRILKETIAINMDNITLDGFVLGDSDPTGFIHTTRGPDCLLTNIPAGGDVSMGNYKINNLVSDDVEQLDALNAKFLWDLMHDNVGVVYV